MSKVITFESIYTIEVNIIKNENHISIGLVYGLEDDTGYRWAPKRITIDESELTATQLQYIEKVIQAAENKAKNIENM